MKVQRAPAAWEQKVARRYDMDLSEDREFLDSVWDYDEFPKFEDYDACVEHHWKFYKLGYTRGRERAGASEDDMSSGGDWRRSHRPQVDTETDLDDETEARVTALSEYLAKIATLDPRVMRFRARALGSLMKTISPEEALELLEACSVPESGSVEGPVRSLWWPDGTDYPKRFRVPKDSVLGELQGLVSYLTTRFPWTDDETVYFILCGGVPRAAPMRAKYTAHLGDGVGAHRYNRPSTITLEVESWAPAELVGTVYRRLQRKFHGGRTPRRPGHRNIEVFRFIVDQGEVNIIDNEEYLAKLKLPPWRQLLEKWNRQFSKSDPRRYADVRVRNFRRDFKRGQEAVIGTQWGLPGVPGQPMPAEKDRETARRNAQLMFERYGQPKRRKKRPGAKKRAQ